MRQVLTLCLLLFVAPAWSRYREPLPPGYLPPTLADIRKAETIAVVRLTTDIAQDPKAVEPLQQLPVRRQVFSGVRVQGTVVEVLKGAPAKTLDLPAGATIISAKKDDRVLVLVRGGGQESWLGAFCYLTNATGLIPDGILDGDEKLLEKEAAGDQPGTLVLDRVRLALRVLAQPTLTAAVTLLKAERIKASPEQQGIVDELLMELGTDPNAVSTDPQELLKTIREKKGVDCWREITALIQMNDRLPSQQIRELIAALRGTPGSLQSIGPLITVRASKDPALLAEVAHDTAMPEALRLDLYARATGLLPNGATGTGEEFQPTAEPPVIAPGFTREEIIAYLAPITADPHNDSFEKRYRFDTVLPILAHLRWPGLEPILIAELPQRKAVNWVTMEQLVSNMGPYDKALDAAMDLINNGQEKDYGILLGVVRGLVDTGSARAIAYVRQLAKQPHPVLKYAPQSVITEMEQRYGPGYNGNTPEALAQQREQIRQALFAADGAPPGSSAALGQHIRFLFDEADQATIERAWTLFRNEAGRTTRSQFLGGYFSHAANPWVQRQMRALWDAGVGPPLESYAFDAMIAGFGRDAAAREKFFCTVVQDPMRSPQTRSTAAQILAIASSEQAVRALHDALAVASFKDLVTAKFTELKIPLPADYRPRLQFEVYQLPESFLKASANWGDRQAIPWILEFSKAGKLPDYQVPLTLVQLDPRLENRAVFEMVVRDACAPKPLYTTARQKLDDTFDRRFFPAAGDDEEIAAWLKAFDQDTLNRAFANHWMTTVTPLVSEEAEDRSGG